MNRDAGHASPPVPGQVAVIVVGAGPVGLLTAIELRRRGIDVAIVEARAGAAPGAKGVAIQPRTVEIFDAVGVAREVLDAAIVLRGECVFRDGIVQPAQALVAPDDMPYRALALPQYDTERVLADHLALLGGAVLRGYRLVGVDQDAQGVSARICNSRRGREINIRARYLVGCDGVGSIVRRQVAVPWRAWGKRESHLLADVAIDWDLTAGQLVRCDVGGSPGATALEAIPIPGQHRYRVTICLSGRQIGRPVGGGNQSAPRLRDIQPAVDQLVPRPAWVHSMRWSAFGRGHRRVAQRYSVGRVFLAGDAAHDYPPIGARGLNTGLHDAYNLGWKLAMVLAGDASPSLLDSYHAERYPLGQSRTGTELAASYRDGPLSADDCAPGAFAGGPAPGDRAPDARGLRQDYLAAPLRWHEMLRHTCHTLLLWAADASARQAARVLAGQVDAFAPHLVRSYIAAPAVRSGALPPSGILVDTEKTLATAYGFADSPGPVRAYLIRPDGHVAYRSTHATIGELTQYVAAAYG